MKKSASIALVLVFLVFSRGLKPEPVAARRLELYPLLKALHWKPAPAADPDYDTTENPGWYHPRNRRALVDFIAKYPDTEEAYLAEVWLIFAKADTDKSRDIKETMRRRKADAEALQRIILKTKVPGVVKMAKILRACELAAAEEHEELKKQAEEILTHIKEYESETNPQYLRLAEVDGTPLSETEPYLRRALIISECHQDHFTEALALAEELQVKFPAWSKRELIHSDIHVLKGGGSPYPTWEQLRTAGPTLEELKRRSKTK